jgi:hypothetical protein
MKPLLQACKLTLLFHSGSPWDFDKQQEWANGITELLGPANGRETFGSLVPETNEATTKNLCRAIRAAIEQSTKT